MKWYELRKLAGVSSLSDVSDVVYSILCLYGAGHLFRLGSTEGAEDGMLIIILTPGPGWSASVSVTLFEFINFEVILGKPHYLLLHLSC